MYYLLSHTKQIKYDSSISEIVFLSLFNQTCTILETWDNVKVKTFCRILICSRQAARQNFSNWGYLVTLKWGEGRVSFMIYLHIF